MKKIEEKLNISDELKNIRLIKGHENILHSIFRAKLIIQFLTTVILSAISLTFITTTTTTIIIKILITLSMLEVLIYTTKIIGIWLQIRSEKEKEKLIRLSNELTKFTKPYRVHIISFTMNTINGKEIYYMGKGQMTGTDIRDKTTKIEMDTGEICWGNEIWAMPTITYKIYKKSMERGGYKFIRKTIGEYREIKNQKNIKELDNDRY